MPHISIKMLEGRTEEQKRKLADALVKTLSETLGASEHWITCTIEDFDAEQWQTVFKTEVEDKKAALYKKPDYDPKDLL